MDKEKSTKRVIIISIIVIVIIIIVVLVLIYIYQPQSSTSSGVTGCDTITPPSIITASSLNVINISVSWNQVNSAASYNIYIGTVPGFTKANALDNFSTASTEFVISGMIVGRTYFIMLESVNACGNTSILSQQISVILGFPSKFKIISRAEPSLALRVAPDFSNIIVDNVCTGVGLNNLCIWQYDADMALIKSLSAPTNCMKTFPANVDVRVKYGNCEDFSYYNSAAARQWNYNDGSLCNPLNPEGFNCIKINGAATAGQSTVRVPFDGNDDMLWDIVEFE